MHHSVYSTWGYSPVNIIPLSEYTGHQDNVKNVHLGVPIGTIVGQDGIVYIHASYMPSCPTSAYKYPQMNILDINCPGGQYIFTVYMIFKSTCMDDSLDETPVNTMGCRLHPEYNVV